MTNTQPLTAADIAALTDEQLNRAILEAKLFRSIYWGLDWSTDANAALELLREMNVKSAETYELWFGLDVWRVSEGPPILGIPDAEAQTLKQSLTAPTPARAICEAWLLWRQEQ